MYVSSMIYDKIQSRNLHYFLKGGKSMKYENLIKDILNNIGGKSNINSVTHCITRLRFKLKDESICNTEVIKNLKGVVTVMQSGGQYQVVIGNHVPEVYAELMQIAGLSDNTEGDAPSSGNFFERLIDILSGVFQPILGVLAATGMIKGFLALFTYMKWMDPTGGTYIILYAIADCLFNFMPIFLGFTASKKFGLNQFIGMAIGASLVYPTIGASLGNDVIMTLFQGTFLESAINMKFLGIPVIIPMSTYVSTVIPVIVAVAAAAPLEKWLRRILPSVVRSFLTPFFTLIVIVPLTFIVIGPITSWASSALGLAISTLYGVSPIITGIILGATWQILVIFGLHWGIIPLALLNLAQSGIDPILALVFACSFAQTGVVGAIALKTKNTELKSLSIPAFISGIFGVTEAAIYGITLPRIKYFVISCIGGAIGGALAGLLGAQTFIMGGLGVFAYPNYINPNGPENFMIQAIIISLVGLAFGFIATFMIYKDDVVASETSSVSASAPTTSSMLKNDSVVYSPLKGSVIPLEQLEDAAFASGTIGKGLAINPIEGKVYSPVNGKITVLFETKHAICVTADDGTEIMIHIGMDTVQLKGKYFTTHVKEGDTVRKGQLLVDVDLNGIKDSGFAIVTPVIITNYTDCLDIINTTNKNVNPGDELLYVINEKK